MQAADQGWGSNGGQVGALGIAQLEVTGLTGGRKVQGWLYDSLNKGLLAGRIQALMLMSELLEDWYFSWGLLRTEGSLQDVLMELVKVRSTAGIAMHGIVYSYFTYHSIVHFVVCHCLVTRIVYTYTYIPCGTACNSTS